MSRGWIPPTRARPSRAASPWASTSPSRACGRTSSPAPGPSGPSSTRDYGSAFPDVLGEVDLETIYRAVNAVRPSEIRTEADELTYDLHVLLRFELELALFEDDLAVADLPEAWNAKMERIPRHRPRKRRARHPPGHPLGHRVLRVLPLLHRRQRALRPTIRGRGRRAARDHTPDGARRVRRPPRLAAGERPPPRQKVRAGRPDLTRHRQSPEHSPLSQIPRIASSANSTVCEGFIPSPGKLQRQIAR